MLQCPESPNLSVNLSISQSITKSPNHQMPQSSRLTPMKFMLIVIAALLAAAQTPRPDNPQSLARIDAAKKLAADDAWLKAPFSFYCVAGGARANSAAAPALEPVKLFDNLYAVGNSEATVYAITTPQGIILIDSGYADRVEKEVVDGLKALKLDPANVKFILVVLATVITSGVRRTSRIT